MKLIRIDQNSPEWREFRKNKIGGSDAKGMMPLKRSPNSDPAGLWDLVGGMLTGNSSDEPGETPMDRGHRLESSAVQVISEAIELELDDNAGVWVSSENEHVMVSPDAAQPGDEPEYSVEIKHLNAGKHFKFLHKMKNGLSGIDLVPNEAGAYYREQCIQYFVVNENLKVHYFVMRHPDVIYKEHELVIAVIDRTDVQEEVDQQLAIQKKQVARAKDIVNELVGDLF